MTMFVIAYVENNACLFVCLLNGVEHVPELHSYCMVKIVIKRNRSKLVYAIIKSFRLYECENRSINTHEFGYIWLKTPFMLTILLMYYFWQHTNTIKTRLNTTFMIFNYWFEVYCSSQHQKCFVIKRMTHFNNVCHWSIYTLYTDDFCMTYRRIK